MIERGQNIVVTDRGPTRNRLASIIKSPYIFIQGAGFIGDKIKNYGNIGHDLTYTSRGTPAIEAVIFDDAPYLSGQNTGTYYCLRAWMDTLTGGLENQDVQKLISWPDLDRRESQSMLMFFRMNVIFNAWKEQFITAGTTSDSTTQNGWDLSHTDGAFTLFYRHTLGGGGGTSLPLFSVGAGLHNILLFFNPQTGKQQLTAYIDGVFDANYSLATMMTEWGQNPALYNGLMNNPNGLSLGTDVNLVGPAPADIIPGLRNTNPVGNYMLGSNIRDILLMETSGNEAKVESNLAAIAALFERTTVGHLHEELKDLVE